MGKLLIGILLLLATSCVTLDKCIEKFPVTYNDTLKVTYRDTVYFFKTFSDTVYASGELWDTINVSTGMTVGYGWIVKDTLKIKLIQRDTVYAFRDSIRTEIKEIVKTVTVTEPCQKSPVLTKVIIIMSILLIGIIVLKFR